MNLSPLMKKYWGECIVEMPNGYIVEAAYSLDGLVYLLPFKVAWQLTLHYPYQDQGGWYFNATRDRYIAEYCADGILVNPQFISKHCEVAL